MDRFAWTPGKGIDASALARLRLHLQRPSKPMGEAWFMGLERLMFTELLTDLDNLQPQELQRPLVEIASGISCFGPLEEWTSWYHYLLGALVTRSHEEFVEDILEHLVTGFMAVYPNGIQDAPYARFREDALLTLGCAIMDSQCWNGSEIVVGSILHRSNNNPNRVWCWWDASGDFSSSMFFCMKYLPESLITNWFKSVLAIPSSHWRAQLIAWLVGAHPMLTNQVQWPSQMKEGVRPSVSWAWSHCLRPELATTDRNGETPMASLLPDASRDAVLQTVHDYFTEDMFIEWLSSISTVPYLELELAEIPTTFEHLYLRPNSA